MLDENNIAATPEATEENPEITALEARIDEEQNKIPEILCELGDAYARKYSTSFDPDFTPIFNKLFATQNNITAIQGEIRTLKGLTLCANCKHEYPIDAPACQVCGCPNPSYVPPVPETKPNTCVACGAPLVEGNAFCTNCGRRIETEEAAVEAAPAAPLTCKNCGSELREGAAFCTRCGTKIETEAPAEKLCPNCGTKLHDGDAFCVNCGTKIG